MWILAHQTARDRAIKAIKAAPDGMVVTIKPAKRSSAQNARMWAMLHEIATQVEWHGTYLQPEDWKAIFSATLHGMRVVPNLENNGFVALGQSTRAMTKKEFQDIFLLIEKFGAEHDVKFEDENE